MASPTTSRLLTIRDHQLLAALDFSPLTARQLLKLSATWSQPFRHLRTLRERLQQLGEVGLVKIFRYATLYPGQPEQYYLLARAGFQALHGPDAIPPTKGHFAELAISRHAHARGLADFLVNTAVAAQRAGVQMTGLYRENSLRLTAGNESVYPDAGFLLIRPQEAPLRFFVEIDCGTETLRSAVSERTWERKARIYDRVQDQFDHRFRVLVVTVRAGSDRLTHILETAGSGQRNPDRTLFCGITLFAYLGSELGVTAPLFVDHRGRRQSLLPDKPFQGFAKQRRLLVPAGA